MASYRVVRGEIGWQDAASGRRIRIGVGIGHWVHHILHVPAYRFFRGDAIINRLSRKHLSPARAAARHRSVSTRKLLPGGRVAVVQIIENTEKIVGISLARRGVTARNGRCSMDQTDADRDDPDYA